MNEPDSVSSRLGRAIHVAIARAGGWLPFDRFMALALYAPGLGYYANGRRVFGTMPGSGSDFVTAPELSAYFGRTLARQVTQAMDASGCDEVVEFGAGSGALAEQLLGALGDRVQRYRIVDLSGSLRERQQSRLLRFGDRVQWLDALPATMTAVVIGNEVVDAMPVKLLARGGDQWRERGVTSEAAAFRWRDVESTQTPPLYEELPPGTVTEIHPQAEAWIATLAERLLRGVVILIDYGFPEAEYYHPQRHGGTLMCHRAHRADTDPLVDVGLKDITAHVNFSGLALAAQDAGLDVLGYTSQGRFLLNCGLPDLLEAASLPERAMAQKLINEHEMGELFKVIAFGKGLPAAFEPIGFVAGDRTHRL